MRIKTDAMRLEWLWSNAIIELANPHELPYERPYDEKREAWNRACSRIEDRPGRHTNPQTVNVYALRDLIDLLMEPESLGQFYRRRVKWWFYHLIGVDRWIFARICRKSQEATQ